MIILVKGTPDSGKSALAEKIVCDLSEPENRIYLATMIAYDDAGRQRILKHRKMRENKGFETIEKPYDIGALTGEWKDKTILLECISNLVGNEMYENESRKNFPIDYLTDLILADILRLAKLAGNMVIVTNSFEKEASFDEATCRYIDAIDVMNEKLQKIADRVECV